jgi:hypothetical protein
VEHAECHQNAVPSTIGVLDILPELLFIDTKIYDKQEESIVCHI